MVSAAEASFALSASGMSAAWTAALQALRVSVRLQLAAAICWVWPARAGLRPAACRAAWHGCRSAADWQVPIRLLSKSFFSGSVSRFCRELTHDDGSPALVHLADHSETM